MDWPNNKKFAFTIIDDTNDSFVDIEKKLLMVSKFSKKK